MFNLWDFLVNAVVAGAFATINWLLPPDTSPNAINNSVDFAAAILNTIVVVFELVGGALSMFNWKLLLVAIGWMISMFVLQLVYAVWKFIGSLLGMLAKFFI